MNKRIIKFIIAVIIGGSILQACKKEASPYEQDTPATNVNLNSIDFLKSQTGMYDSLLYILHKLPVLEDSLTNNSVTFFAPQDISILTAINNINATRIRNGKAAWIIDSVPLPVWDTLMRRYMIPGVVTPDSIRFADGVDFSTMSGYWHTSEETGEDIFSPYKMHADLVKQSTSGSTGTNKQRIQYSDKNFSRFRTDWSSSYVKTSSLITTNGVLHLLEPNHVFGFSSFVTFINR
jgi:hypothetical protein